MLIIRIGDQMNKRIAFDKNIPEANTIINRDNISSLLETCSPDIFGNKPVIRIENIFNTEKKEKVDTEPDSKSDDTEIQIDTNGNIDYKKIIYNNLENIIKSDNVFIIDEISIMPPTAKKLIDDSNKIISNNNLDKKYFSLYDARKSDIEKKKEDRDADSNPFQFCEALAKGDKKNAWIELIKLKHTNCVDVELIGASMWKIKQIRNPKIYYELITILNNSKKRNAYKIYDKLEELVLKL